MVPSGPNRGPGAIRTPADGASSARSVANGPGSRTHSEVPPAGSGRLPIGQFLGQRGLQRGGAGGQP